MKNGSLIKPNNDLIKEVVAYTSGPNGMTYTWGGVGSLCAIDISNDSLTVDMTFRTDTTAIDMKLKPGDVFSAKLPPFTVLTVTSTDAWRAWLYQ